MKKQKGGIRIGHYRISLGPLGIVTVCILVLALIGGGLFLFKDKLFGNGNDITAGTLPAASPTAAPAIEIVPMTPTPVPTQTPEPTPVPTPTPKPTPRSASIRFIGEIAIDDNVLSAALQPDGSYSFADMLSTAAGAVGNADYTVANVEGSMGGIGSGYSGRTNFNSPEILISELKDIGVDMLTLANDHALDTGFDGLLNTIANCQDAGMEYVGAAVTQEEHDTPKLIEINGINVCFLNYTSTLNSREKSAGSDAVKYGVNLAAKSDSRKDAKAAREAGADVIIAVVSWSEDGETRIDSTQKKIAQILVESGVDAIIGYGPRNTQAVLWLDTTDDEGNVTDSTICAISLGTFLSNSKEARMDWGSIFEITISEQADGSFLLEAPTSIPTYVWKYSDDERDYFRVLTIGEWTEEQPEGMSDEDYARLTEIWTEMPEVVTDVCEVSVN